MTSDEIRKKILSNIANLRNNPVKGLEEGDYYVKQLEADNLKIDSSSF